MNERALFIATMRQPEMRLLRAALRDLKWEHGIPWETVTRLEITPPQPPYTDGWILESDEHISICPWSHDENPTFYVYKSEQ